MGAGTKILAGCGCAAMGAAVVVVAVVAGVGLGAWWLKGQATEVTASLEALTSTTSEIEEWERQVRSYPYERPADDVIPEERLLAFLGVRRNVHDVYQTYEANLETLQESVEGGDATASAAELIRLGGTVVRMFNDLRLAQLKALAGAGMSEEEYYAIQAAVYIAAGAWETSDKTGRLPAEAVADTARQVREAMRVGLEEAREQQLPGSNHLSEAELRRLEEALAEVEVAGADVLAVPRANIELFRKHEDAIRQYAMHGLALVGL